MLASDEGQSKGLAGRPNGEFHQGKYQFGPKDWKGLESKVKKSKRYAGGETKPEKTAIATYPNLAKVPMGQVTAVVPLLRESGSRRPRD
jgi:hypothetical protein